MWGGGGVNFSHQTHGLGFVEKKILRISWLVTWKNGHLVQPVQLFESTIDSDSSALNVVFFPAVPVLRCLSINYSLRLPMVILIPAVPVLNNNLMGSSE